MLLATPAQAEDTATRIQRQYENLTSFSADFSQTLTNAASGEAEKRSGSIHFRQPQNILWETKTPEPEILMVGDSAVWNYFPAEEVAYKYPVEQILGSKTVLRFLSGKANLKEDFYVEETPAQDGGAKLKLIPKNPEPTMIEAEVWVNDTGMITKVLVVDFYANTNEVELNNVVLNPGLTDGMFRFEAPKGVDVFDNTQ
jgi:outer membrane lipoprotein carrier protein